MKYFKVKYVEKAVSVQGRFLHKRTEIYMAKDSVAVYEDLDRRFGERLVSVDMVELDESKTKKNASVSIAI